MTDETLNPEEIRADMQAGTPGPWTADEEGSPHWGKNFSILYNGNKMVDVAEMVCTEEDARRIARLPDLERGYLDMRARAQAAEAERDGLRAFVEIVADGHPDDFTDHCDKARAALKDTEDRGCT